MPVGVDDPPYEAKTKTDSVAGVDVGVAVAAEVLLGMNTGCSPIGALIVYESGFVVLVVGPDAAPMIQHRNVKPVPAVAVKV